MNIDSKHVKYFEDQPDLAGKLIGIIFSSANGFCRIPDDWKIEINIGEKVTAGETILAVK